MNVDNSPASSVSPAPPPPLDEQALRSLGVMTPAMLAAKATQKPAPFVVEDLIYERTLNLVVGHSGLGKTPLLATLATCITSGTPFLGRNVKQSPILYCDAEMGLSDFTQLQQRIAKHLGLVAPTPEFFLWSLSGEDSPTINIEAHLDKQIAALKPAVVFIERSRRTVHLPEFAVAALNRQRAAQRKLKFAAGTKWVESDL